MPLGHLAIAPKGEVLIVDGGEAKGLNVGALNDLLNQIATEGAETIEGYVNLRFIGCSLPRTRVGTQNGAIGQKLNLFLLGTD